MSKSIRNIAFTMSEMLLVIGIIGIIASLTLPNLNNNADERVNVAKAKKAYSDLSAAVDRVSLKYDGSPNTWGASNTVSRLNSMLKPKGQGTSYWYEAGNCANVATGLSDGTTYCAVANNATCMDILLDVDGPKKGMNSVGYDVFKGRIAIPTLSTDPIELRPWSCADAGSFTTTTKPGTENYLNWVVQNDNMDYRKCNTLSYQNVITCK